MVAWCPTSGNNVTLLFGWCQHRTPIRADENAGERMSRPQRFCNKIEFYTNDQQLRGIEILCADGLSDRATHMRQALQMYLQACGIVAPPQPAQSINGQHQERANGL
jgi:hypothetical protein